MPRHPPPSNGATLVGLTVTTSDTHLIDTIVKVYKGILYCTPGTSASFAIEPPQ